MRLLARTAALLVLLMSTLSEVAQAVAPTVSPARSPAKQDWELKVCADPDSLPFSRRDQSGFDNRIAQILAAELGAKLSFVWWPQGQTMVSEQLREGRCDMIVGVPDGYGELLNTVAYYQSPYVFIYRTGRAPIRSLDDPALHQLNIGVQRTGIPPHQALLKRGLAANVLLQRGDLGSGTLGFVVDAVRDGVIDVGIVWGPVAGFYAQQRPGDLALAPVTPEVELPFLKMSIAMTIGVRQGDDSLRDHLDAALVNRWDEIQAVFRHYGVPVSPLPKPLLQLEVGGSP